MTIISPLAVYTKFSPNYSERTQPITKFTPHHMSGNLSIETCGNIFFPAARKASSNYGIDTAGRCGCYVPEDRRSWCSSSAWNDQRAITVEIANSVCSAPWPISDAAWDALVELAVDVIKRNPGIKRADGVTPGLNYTGDKTGSLTEHRMFSDTDCPGQWLHEHMKEFEAAVNKKLDTGSSTPKPIAGSQTTKPAVSASASSGNEKIREFQKWLNKTYGWNIGEDGLYGSETKKHAVMALQTELNNQFDRGLAVDGIFGTKTYQGCVSVKSGAKGNITMILQGMLYCKGFDPKGLDGKFGTNTGDAVEKFQRSAGLTPDRIAGKNTLKNLFA